MKLRIVYEGEANSPLMLSGATVSSECEFEANDRITLYQVADTFLRHVTGQPTRFDEESSLRRAHQEELDRQKAECDAWRRKYFDADSKVCALQREVAEACEAKLSKKKGGKK